MGALGLVSACSSSDNDGKNESAVRSEHAYGVVTQVLGTEGATTYVNILDSLDATGIDRAEAREFPGTTSAASIDGKLFVASGEAPIITRFDVTNRTNWTDEGRINFAAQGLSAASFFTTITTGPQKAYSALNVVDRIVWDPSRLQIQGMVRADARIQLVRDGLTVNQGYEQAVEGNRAFQPFYWASSDFQRFAPYSQVAVYDTGTDQTRALLDTPCPHLHRSAKDDQGNVYFSSGPGSATQWLYDASAPRNCMVRIKAGEDRIDTDFTIRFEELTGGFEAAAFQYYGGDKGFLAVFDHRAVTPVNPNASIDERRAVNESENWHFWVLNLTTRKAAPMNGIGAFTGQFFSVRLDGRVFVLLPKANYVGTRVYEILPDLSAQFRFESTGWIYEMFKVR
ncbi:hypothetical protein LZC95_23875 [Pendulispora brunnea]|uniref:Uncharacterized protein n=1 Tax=Pendulispora brunnea TaxID=2905690 RepID=A0ABZ2KME7_9BACT